MVVAIWIVWAVLVALFLFKAIGLEIPSLTFNLHYELQKDHAGYALGLNLGFNIVPGELALIGCFGPWILILGLHVESK